MAQHARPGFSAKGGAFNISLLAAIGYKTGAGRVDAVRHGQCPNSFD
jgi:hypothetical protein